MIMKRLWVFGLVLLQVFNPAFVRRSHGIDLEAMREKAPGPGLTSEYIYRNDPEEALIPIYLLGAVSKPGLYHVPSNTDIVGLLTLAGGPLPDAEVDRILVKNQKTAPKREIRFDLDYAVSNVETPRVPLASNDLVYVTPGKPPVTNTVLTVVGILAGVVGVVASSILIGQNIK